MEKLLKTGPGTDTTPADLPPPRQTEKLFMHDMNKDGRIPGPDDRELVARHATDAEVAELAKKIRARRAALPPFRFVKCSDPRCGYKARIPYESPVTAGRICIRCNIWAMKEGGFLVEMTKAEAEQFLADEAAAFKKRCEESERREFNWTNDRLRAEGKEPMALEAFRTMRQKQHEARVAADVRLAALRQKSAAREAE
jgi:hypothetical protein